MDKRKAASVMVQKRQVGSFAPGRAVGVAGLRSCCRRPGRRGLPFFVEDQLRIDAVLSVSTDQDEIHVCQDSEAAVSPKLALHLIPQVGGLVVQEFDVHSVWKPVFQIDEPSD